MKTGQVIMAVVVVAIIAAGFWVWQADHDKPTFTDPIVKMTLAVYAGDVAALAFLAQEDGLFIKNGVEVTLKEYNRGMKTFDAFSKGEADVATIPELGFIAKMTANPGARIFGSLSTYNIREVVARRDKGITVPGDLRGRRIGLSGDMSTYYLGVFLPLHGMKYTDVVTVRLPPSDINAALLSGTIDAAVTWEPNVSHVKKELGENAISFTPPEGLAPETTFVLVANASWLQQNGETAARFLRGLKAAEAFVAANPDKAKSRIAARFALTPDYVASVLSRINLRTELTQRLLVAMEDEARWGMANNVLSLKDPPNFLDYFVSEPLSSVDADAVTLLR